VCSVWRMLRVASCVQCVENVAGGELCAVCGECCLTGFSSGGFVGGVKGQLNKRVILSRVLLGNELPFFVERL